MITIRVEDTTPGEEARVLAALSTDERAVAAANLRAVADVLDPPRAPMRIGGQHRGGVQLTVTDPAPGGPVADVGAVVDALQRRDARRRQIPG